MLPSDAKVAVIGAGPAGLMAAEVLAGQGVKVTVHDRMPSAGRKFLIAGRGGLNLTHSEDFSAFLGRYGDAAPELRAAIEALPPAAVRAWCEALGQETFVGTSGRVFPRSLKASPLLRAWLRRLSSAGVEFKFRQRWTGWDQAGRSAVRERREREGRRRHSRARRRKLAEARLGRQMGGRAAANPISPSHRSGRRTAASW